ncbi:MULTISPECIES: flagellar basal body rod protein FlgG [Bacillaceae]|uniref:Flagellar hook protein FlgE n=1 Tax=Domibacillus aminovorans TaxID=29332 RepID=A0A177KK42_9BACI|nr:MULTISPECIES: flagellar basal body rod protein FlgG [Bacillaceae]OAH53768.1 flagellar basal-body rod protein FlgG [Domibacillus aminovorans]
MLRAMYSGYSGLKSSQTELDVTSNNIANVNTHGFKKGRTTFKDMLSQQVSGATEPSANRGGTNPLQIGLGIQIGSIDTIQTQGSLQTTGRSLDLAISGEGFFMLGRGDGTTITDHKYTRSGSFSLDENGHVVNSDGDYLIKAVPDPANPLFAVLYIPINLPTTASNFNIEKDGTITYTDENGMTITQGGLPLAKFTNPEGLEKSGTNNFSETVNSGAPMYTWPGEGGVGTVVTGMLEMSNVDFSEEFTEMIVAQRSFQANSRVITTADEIVQEIANLKR